MIIKQDLPVSKISWLTYPQNGGGIIDAFYEPETLDELIELCKKLQTSCKHYDVVGHTSNIYFMPDYSVEAMVSTRKLTFWKEEAYKITAECGVAVKKLANEMIAKGIEGFEGLIDLPGTVASAVYGNASCYGSSISSLLLSADVLTEDGKVEKVTPDWFGFRKRSSSLKRGEKHGIILSVELKKNVGIVEEIRKKADDNRRKRKNTQPEPVNCLGSIFANKGKPSLLNYCIKGISKIYNAYLIATGIPKEIRLKRREHLVFVLLRGTDVEPYVRTWNWYQWHDDLSHTLFWKYVKLHRLMYTKSDFEIEIKRKT